MDILAIGSIFLMIWVIVGIHEFGHLLAAQKCGVGIEKFSIGLGPKLLSLYKKGRFPVHLCLIPLGGFVKIKGEKWNKPPNPDIPGKSIQDVWLGKQIFIFTAGVGFNLIFAFILGIILFIFSPDDIHVQLGAQQLIFQHVDSIPLALFSNFLYVFGLFIDRIIGIPLAIWQLIISPVGILAPTQHGGFSGLAGLGENIHLGIWSYLGLVYVLSIVIASFNILPILPLDGGQIITAGFREFFGPKSKAFKIIFWIASLQGFAILGIIVVKAIAGDFHRITTEHDYKGLMLISVIVILLILKFLLSKINKKKE